nr:unnamed protein product [Callosobruchus chinensis]
MEYTNGEMADMHYVYRLSQGNGIEASRRFAEIILYIEYFSDFINDYENVVHWTKERRIVVAIERRPLKRDKLLEELEHPDRIHVHPVGVIFFPLKTANDDVTDCDSGDEEFTTMAAN